MKKLWLWHAPQGSFDIALNVFNAVLRLGLVVLAAGFVSASVSAGAGAQGSVGGLWFFVAGAAAFAVWNVWDVAKSWGWIPAARVLIDGSHIAFETPFWRRSFTARTFIAGEPLTLVTREIPVLRAAKSVHTYEFRQGDTKVRYLAPMYITQESAQELKAVLATAGTRLSLPRILR